MKIYEVKGVGKLQGMTVLSLDAFVKGVKPEKEMDESDISGLLHAARNFNRAFLITADLAEGGRKTYRVKAQSERVAREKFAKHFSMAKIVSVKEEGVAEGGMSAVSSLVANKNQAATEVNNAIISLNNLKGRLSHRDHQPNAQEIYKTLHLITRYMNMYLLPLMALQRKAIQTGVGEFSSKGSGVKGVHQDEISRFRKELQQTPQQFLAKLTQLRDQYKGGGAGDPQLGDYLENAVYILQDYLQPMIKNVDDESLRKVMQSGQQGVAEGSEFGAYYYEQLAQQVFDQNPNLSSEDEILNLGYSIAKKDLGARAQGVFRDEDFPGDFVSAYNWLKKQGVVESDDLLEADTENPDRITIAGQGKGYIIYHSFNRDAYTARGVGEWKGQIQPEWFYSLADAEEHAEMEISGHDEHYGRVDELTFKGSTCTKDCSGHEAGYDWYQRKGRIPNSHSKSFNKGADIAANESINEAPGDFGLGANYRDIPDDEIQAFLDRTKNKEKTKRDKYDYPYVHASSVQIKNEEGREYDLDSLRKEIMTRPTSILGQNAKMQHSETGTEAIFDIGLPALKGLAVNEKTGQFVVVDTCPGAGACKTYCYAMKGSYVMFKAVSMGLARMLNFLLNDPEGFKNKLNAEIAAARSKMAKKGARVVVRWHDAGDFFSPEYLDMAYGVARDNPDVGFYAYTKIADVATGDRPKNFNMNFSQGALSGQEKKVDFKRVKHSKVVPKDMFFDLVARKGLNLIKDAKGRMQFASPENLEDFKTRMAKHYAIDKDSILTYDQMMNTPVGDAPKWNVIVMPGDGDNSANRNDVIGSYLLFH